MIAEKTYWIILSAGFICFSLIIWTVIVPISPDLGVNLFTESIFMVLSIVFLSLLYDVREERRWKPIRDKIIERVVTDNLENLFLLAQNLCALPKNRDYSTLAELANMEKVVLRNDIVDFFSEKRNLYGYIEGFDEISKKLHSIQVEYSRLFEPEIIERLVTLELYTRDLYQTLKFLTKIKFSDKSNEKKFFEKSLTPLIDKIIKETYRLYNMGIKFRLTKGFRFIVIPDEEFFR